MNKELFDKLFKNKILKNNIFYNVHHIHKETLEINDIYIYKYKNIVNHPILLAQYGYLDLIKQFLARTTKQLSYFYKAEIIRNSVLFKRLSVVKYMFHDVLANFMKYSSYFHLKDDHLYPIIKIMEGVLLPQPPKPSTTTKEVDNISLANLTISNNEDHEIYSYLYSVLRAINNHVDIEWDNQYSKSGDADNTSTNCTTIAPSNISSTTADIGMDCAIYLNNLQMLKWIHNNTTQRCSSIGILQAFKSGNMEMVEWLHQNRTERYHRKFIRTDFDTLSRDLKKFIIFNYPDSCLPHDILEALINDRELFNYICRNYPQFIKENSILIASLLNDFDIYKLLYNRLINNNNSNNISILNQSLSIAIENDNMEMMIYIMENMKQQQNGGNITIPMDNIIKSIEYGHLDIIKMFIEGGFVPCEKDRKFVNLAARHGHVDVIDYLVSVGYRGGDGIIDIIAALGKFDVVETLLESEHKFSDKAINEAIKQDNPQILKRLLDLYPSTPVIQHKQYSAKIKSILLAHSTAIRKE